MLREHVPVDVPSIVPFNTAYCALFNVPLNGNVENPSYM